MKTICAMRDVFRAMTNFEVAFEKEYQLSLNEAMILCALQETHGEMTATQISRRIELSPSHASKLLRILEEKRLIDRMLGDKDRRVMKFNLTKTGKSRVTELALEKVDIPELLRPLFK